MIDEYDRYIPKGFDWHEASRQLVIQDTEAGPSLVRFWFDKRLPERRGAEAAGPEAEGK